MRLEGACLAVVGGDPTTATRFSKALESEGALVTSSVVASDDLEKLSAPGFDAVVLVLGDRPDAFVPLAKTLASDPRTSSLPVVAVVSPEARAADVAALTGVAFVPHDPGGGAVVAMLERLFASARLAHASALQLRTAREQIQKLAKGRNDVREEASRFSHDLLALVGIVVGYGANLRDEVPGPLSDGQRTHVTRILSATADASALVERFAAFVRGIADVSADEEPISVRRPFDRRGLHDLGRLATSVVALFQQAAEQRRITLAVDASAAEVWCDAMQVKQVVTNLVVNALKFTPEGGRVLVEVRRREVSGDGAAARALAEIVVSDAGPGIPEADAERVFERGVRLDRDRDKSGSGIGLSVVKEVVQAHGGTVRISRSDELGGASFAVALPVDRRARQERPPTVLVLEDAPAARELAAALRTGEVTRASAEAFARAAADATALVVVPHGTAETIEAALRGDP